MNDEIGGLKSNPSISRVKSRNERDINTRLAPRRKKDHRAIKMAYLQPRAKTSQFLLKSLLRCQVLTLWEARCHCLCERVTRHAERIKTDQRGRTKHVRNRETTIFGNKNTKEYSSRCFTQDFRALVGVLALTWTSWRRYSAPLWETKHAVKSRVRMVVEFLTPAHTTAKHKKNVQNYTNQVGNKKTSWTKAPPNVKKM